MTKMKKNYRMQELDRLQLIARVLDIKRLIEKKKYNEQKFIEIEENLIELKKIIIKGEK